jgi:hypothetical protein
MVGSSEKLVSSGVVALPLVVPGVTSGALADSVAFVAGAVPVIVCAVRRR